jgi:hypothetical protein
VLAVNDRVATGIKQALDAAGIDIPYPHNVVLFHDVTGSRLGDRAGEKPDAVESTTASVEPPRR